MSDTIEFIAEVNKVQTLADGGIRLTLDLPEDSILQMAKLVECKRWGAVLRVVATPESLTNFDDETKKRPEGNTFNVDRRRIGHRRDK